MSKKRSHSQSSQIALLLLGYGHVAQAFVPLLASRSQWLYDQLGIHLVIKGIGTLEGLAIYPDGIQADLLAETTSPLETFASAGIQVSDVDTFIKTGRAMGASLLIELTSLHPEDGQPALTYIRASLAAGLDVVTANKGPIAHALADLQRLAASHKVFLRFESTVLDGLPLVNLLQFTLPAVNVHGFRALLNTTSSMVLAMIEQGYTRDEAIAEAQHLGVAETDPWYDLDGWDALMKTTILTNTLLAGNIQPVMVEREGIGTLTLDDIRLSARNGTPLRLVSQAYHQNGTIKAVVRPQRILPDDILRVGEGTTNVISLETEAMGTITWVEHAPTVMQTAYGIFSDIFTILNERHKYNKI